MQDLCNPGLEGACDGGGEHCVVYVHEDDACCVLDRDDGGGVDGGDALHGPCEAAVQTEQQLQCTLCRAVAARDGGQHCGAAEHAEHGQRVAARRLERVGEAAEGAWRQLALEPEDEQCCSAAVEHGLAAGACVREGLGDEGVAAARVDAGVCGRRIIFL